MLMVVAFALRGAGVACPGTQLERLAQHLIVRSGAPEAEVRRSIANVGTIETSADALAHIHLLGGAGIGAAKTHPCTVQEVVGGIGQRLVDVAGGVRVKADHLANGH